MARRAPGATKRGPREPQEPKVLPKRSPKGVDPKEKTYARLKRILHELMENFDWIVSIPSLQSFYDENIDDATRTQSEEPKKRKTESLTNEWGIEVCQVGEDNNFSTAISPFIEGKESTIIPSSGSNSDNFREKNEASSNDIEEENEATNLALSLDELQATLKNLTSK